MFKSLFKLSGASIVAQVVSFLVMPVITRMNTPDSLGEYQYFTTLALVLSPIISGRLDYAILSAPTRTSALKILRFSVQYVLLVSLVLLLTTPLVNRLVAGTNLHWVQGYMPILALFLFLCANFQLAMAFLTNEKKYGLQATFTITKSVASNILKIVFSYISASGFSLIMSLVVTELFQVARIVRLSLIAKVKKLYRPDLRFAWRMLRRLRVYPTYVTLTDLMGILMNWFPILVTGFFYGRTYTGLLGLAFMVVNTPVYPFISALRTVCFGELARERTKKLMFSVYSKSFLIALVPSISGLLVLGFFSRELFVLVFGEKWIEAGPIAFVCFIPITLSFLLSPIYSSLNHFFSFQRVFFVISLIVLVCGVGMTSYIGYRDLDFEYFIMAFAVTMSLSHLSLFFASIYLVRSRMEGLHE